MSIVCFQIYFECITVSYDIIAVIIDKHNFYYPQSTLVNRTDTVVIVIGFIDIVVPSFVAMTLLHGENECKIIDR